jgi:hypothetical protein
VDSSQSCWEKNRYYIGARELSREETRPSRAERRRERKKKFQSWKVFEASPCHVTGRNPFVRALSEFARYRVSILSRSLNPEAKVAAVDQRLQGTRTPHKKTEID